MRCEVTLPAMNPSAVKQDRLNMPIICSLFTAMSKDATRSLLSDLWGAFKPKTAEIKVPEKAIWQLLYANKFALEAYMHAHARRQTDTRTSGKILLYTMACQKAASSLKLYVIHQCDTCTHPSTTSQ